GATCRAASRPRPPDAPTGGREVTDRPTAATPADRALPPIDTTLPHTSRIYDYLLGGHDHFEVDRRTAEHAFAAYPGGVEGARADAQAHRASPRPAVRF